MSKFSWRILDKDKKLIELGFEGTKQKFQLRVKRAFVVLVELCKRYPGFMNIHELDELYNDPNRALSDLRISDGFDGFIEEERPGNRVIHARLNVPKLIDSVNLDQDIIQLSPDIQRVSLSEQDKNMLFTKFGGRCNITGVDLVPSRLASPSFMSRWQQPVYDHRRPLEKSGTNDIANIQLLSEAANQEKKKICNVCVEPNCNSCALAYPERMTVIYPTGQNISGIRRK